MGRGNAAAAPRQRVLQLSTNMYTWRDEFQNELSRLGTTTNGTKRRGVGSQTYFRCRCS